MRDPLLEGQVQAILQGRMMRLGFQMKF